MAINTAGTKPIKVLKIAVKVSAAIISLIFIVLQALATIFIRGFGFYEEPCTKMCTD